METPDQKMRASKIETAKRLKGIRDISDTPEDYEATRNRLVAPEDVEAVERSINGLSQEDEFALMCRLMGTTTHLVRLEQNPIFRGNFIIPDFIARFQPGCSRLGYTKDDSTGFNCLIDVKSTDKLEIKIGKSELVRRRNFAQQFGLPLLFAARFLHFGRNAVWVIIEDADHSKTNLTITIDDLNHGIRDILWDDYSYFLPGDIHFAHVYDTASPGFGVGHRQFGLLKEFQIVSNDRTITLYGRDAGLFAGFFEAFELEAVEAKMQGTTTTEVVKPVVQICTVADMLYRFNRLATDANGKTVFDASKLLARADQNSTEGLITKETISGITHFMFEKGLILKSATGSTDDVRVKWVQYGGK